MPNFAANLSLLFNEVPFLDRFERAAAAGFKGVEFLFPYEHDPAEIAARLTSNGLSQILFNLPAGNWAQGERGIAIYPNLTAEFRTSIPLAVRYAKALGCTRLHCLAGKAPISADHRALRKTYVENLRHAARVLADEGMTLLIEPINTRDVPGYFLDTTAKLPMLSRASAPITCACSSTTSIICRSWRAISRRRSASICPLLGMFRSPIRRDVTSQEPERSIIPSSSRT
jgi:hydroxypyruvate isomerase